MRRSGKGTETDEISVEVAFGAAGDEVAHVRARFAVDPATPSSLDDAWTAPTGTLEEDESEFLDAVADCLSVGLPIDAAVASWRSGTLEVTAQADQDEQNEQNEQNNEEEDTTVFEDDDTRVYVPASNRGAPAR